MTSENMEKSDCSNAANELKVVGTCIPKKDSSQLLLGKPVYMDDCVPKDCLIVKILRSPHASAVIEEIDTSAALKVPGVEAVFTWKDVPQIRFTIAGQTYPELAPYDKMILDRIVRCVGDPVALIAAETEAAADLAMRKIKVRYDVKTPVLDFHNAIDNPNLVHPEDNFESHDDTCIASRNLLFHGENIYGDTEAVLKDCDEVLTETWRAKACQQAYMETIRAYAEIDTYGRLHIISSTQIVFHVRRIVARALGISKSKVRVEKKRIGGGFGAKQTAVCEVYPAFVTWMLKKPCKLIYSREECQIISSPRHEMELTVKLGADRDGRIRAIDLYTISNAGAYGEHSSTTVTLSAEKTLPLYTTGCEAAAFRCDVVYTNSQSAGAYRGFGATQGLYAVESTVNMLADKLGIDPLEIRLKNILKEGQVLKTYYNMLLQTCSLDRCIRRCAENFDWEHKYPVRDMGNGKVRAAGVAIAMQGSCIANVDVGSCTIRLGDDGIYVMSLGSGDMGTGSDTILAQMAAEALMCDVDNIAVFSADTDTSPYDSGSYASSTTYVTGMAVKHAAEALIKKLCMIAAKSTGADVEDLVFDGKFVENLKTGEKTSLDDITLNSQLGNQIAAEASATWSSPVSPPPFMVGMAEIELDKETGSVEVLDYQAVIDCGTPVNPNLARTQAEGGLLQGIGMALYEDVHYTEDGRIMENSFMQYKIPTRDDVGRINVEFEATNEPTGPFGAKSIGEVVINTPTPAIAHAIYRAAGVWLHTTPFTPEKILMSMNDPEWKERETRW